MVLKYDMPIRFIGIAIILVTVRLGTLYIAYGEVAVAIIGVLLYSRACKKSVDYSLLEVMGDFLPNVFISLLMGVVVYGVGACLNTLPDILVLLLQILVGAASYVLISKVTKNKNFDYVLGIIKRKKN